MPDQKRFQIDLVVDWPSPATAQLTNLKSYMFRIRQGSNSDPILPYLPIKKKDWNDGLRCKINLWELDRWFIKKGGKKIERSEQDKSQTNELLAEFEGIVVQSEAKRYDFVASRVGYPSQQSESKREDYIKIKFKKKPENSATIDDATYEVALVKIRGETEHILDCGAVLSQMAGSTDYSSVPFPGVITHVINIRRAIQTQLQDGGLTVAFYVLPPKGELEFERRARELGRFFGAFAITQGRSRQLTIGANLINDWRDINRIIQEIQTHIAEKYYSPDKRPDPLSIKINRLMIFCHGGTNWLNTGDVWANRLESKYVVEEIGGEQVNKSKLAAFIRGGRFTHGKQSETIEKGIKDLMTANAVISLCACLTGRSSFAPKIGKDVFKTDPTYGLPPGKGQRIGQDSFAEYLRDKLIENGITDPTVWAHTTASHTTRNSMLRVFNKDGAKDLLTITNEGSAPRPFESASLGQWNSAVNRQWRDSIRSEIEAQGTQLDIRLIEIAMTRRVSDSVMSEVIKQINTQT